MKIGVLAVQGDFLEHIICFKRLNIEAIEVKTLNELETVEGLVLPGGESTTISKSLDQNKISNPICEMAMAGLPVWGTCAGLILLSKNITDEYPKPLGLLDITMSRNFYGRQIDSFVQNIKFNSDRIPFEAIFIRAPSIIKTGFDIQTLAVIDEDVPVAVRKNNILGTTFHPELTNDLRIHKYFVTMIANAIKAP